MRRLIALLIVGLAAAPRMAAASVIVPLTEDELVARADTILFGTVVKLQAVRSPTGFVSTRVDVQVYRGLKGIRAGEVAAVEVPGGDLGHGIDVAVSGSPRPAIGDMVFGFFERHGEVLRPLGMSFGFLAVKQGAAGELRVFRELEGLHFADKPGTKQEVSAFAISGESLDDFTSRIERRVRALPATPATPATPAAAAAGEVKP